MFEVRHLRQSLNMVTNNSEQQLRLQPLLAFLQVNNVQTNLDQQHQHMLVPQQ